MVPLMVSAMWKPLDEGPRAHATRKGQAKSDAGLPDLAQHGGQRNPGPDRLLAMVASLHAERDRDHDQFPRHEGGEITYVLCRRCWPPSQDSWAGRPTRPSDSF